VAIAGDTIVGGADGEESDGSSPDDNSALYAGAVYVFGRTHGSWTEQAYLKASNAEAGAVCVLEPVRAAVYLPLLLRP
jgi:hypothetical protein